jgi:hypothetical protein
MIRKLRSGGYRLYSRKKNPRTGKRRNLGTFKTKLRPRNTNKRFGTLNGADSRRPGPQLFWRRFIVASSVTTAFCRLD